VVDDIAVIVEGIPPDVWGITIVPDDGYTDWTWPGHGASEDSEQVAQARLAIRHGDYAAAMDLLEEPAKAEDPAAAALMGDMYRLARLGVIDNETAADWYLVAGRFRYAPAVYSLATASDEGWGMLTLNGVRMPLLVDAAELGEPDAIYILSGQDNGIFYVRSEDLTKFDQAQMAATWGLLAAQLHVAARYAAGDGTAPDPVLAYAWASLALANVEPGLDYIRAHQLAVDLKEGLTPDQIAEAERLTETLVTGPPPPDQIPPQGASQDD
jgi:hypothetical protein